MATGFIFLPHRRCRSTRPLLSRVGRNCIAALALMAGCAAAGAVQVGLAGVVGGKAMLLIDGTVTRTIAVGQRTPEGIKLIAIENGGATLEVDGVRQSLRLGQNASGGNSAQTVVLNADSRGHYITTGSVNGYPVRFMVDTGASAIALSASEAKRIGISLHGSERMFAQTANGVAAAQRVRLDNVRIGGISVDGVEATVSDGEMPFALLGMSFLNRMEMQNDNGRMTLKKRY